MAKNTDKPSNVVDIAPPLEIRSILLLQDGTKLRSSVEPIVGGQLLKLEPGKVAEVEVQDGQGNWHTAYVRAMNVIAALPPKGFGG